MGSHDKATVYPDGSSCTFPFRSDHAREVMTLKNRIADLELEVRKMTEVNNDNSKLKQENAALIRIISKLSK